MEEFEKKWEEILLRVKEEHDLTDVSFKTWLKPLKIYEVRDHCVYVLVSGEQMGLTYIAKKYYRPLKVAIAEITGTEYEVEFLLPEQAQQRAAQHAAKPPRPPVTEAAERASLNPYYTFESFVVGNNNRFAHSASLAVAETPGEVYNPLFIYGGVGLGKTHLMQSIAHFILLNHPELKVLYVSSETFTNELIEAIRNGNNSALSQFRDKYRNIDVLLIDDVQFIIGKESTQEEFFHTFNELREVKKQIIISSDRPPKEMETLEERLRSRFEWGLLADIGSPDYETRMAILRKKQEQEGISLSDDVLNYIAINIKSNVRELEGALNKLVAFSHMEHTDISLDIAVSELQNIISPDKPHEVTPQLIIEVVSEHFGITVDQIMSKSRTSNVAKPRQIAMYLCKTMTDHPLDSIGQLLGGRDHSTIIHGINKVRDEIMVDDEFRQVVETVRKKVNPN